MKKLQLHWQILIALIIAILYGMMFTTNYTLDKAAFISLKKTSVPFKIQDTLEKELKGKVFGEKRVFRKELQKVIGKEAAEKYDKVILKRAYSNPAVSYVSWMGDIFLRLLKMLIIPLILSSIISGVTNIGSGQNLGRIGLKTIFYYVSTSMLAIITGLLLVNLFKPGVGADLNLSEDVEGLVDVQKTLGETLIEIVPDNIFRAMATADMLSIIFFAIIFGFFITRANEKPRVLLTNFFNAIFDVMMKITMFVIKLTPIGIFGIVAKVVADQDDLVGLISRMGLYMGTVVAALSIHAFITLPLLVKLVGKAGPYSHLSNMTTPLLTAFSTSSSGATLPLTMSTVEKKSGVSNKISSFTLPLGATINMDGTALYECVAAMFIAQAYGVDLAFYEQLIVLITGLLASIGAAAIPMAGLVMITVILSAVGLPLEGVGLILAVDRILDMFRTATNVWSDSCGAVIIAKSEKEKLNV